MSETNVFISVYTPHNTNHATRFENDSLHNVLHVWFLHAINTSPAPEVCLGQLLAFLQHPSFTFHITSDIEPAGLPAGPLRLLSLVYYPADSADLRWIQSDLLQDPQLEEKAAPLLPPLEADECGLVFITKDGELLLWHAYHEFDNAPCLKESDTPQLWRAQGISDLQLCQDTTDQTLPVIPEYLCEIVAFESIQGTYIVADEKPLINAPPLRLPLPTLLRVFANQPYLLPCLNALPPLFEVSIAYSSRYQHRKDRKGFLCIEASSSPDENFCIQSTFDISSTDRNTTPLIVVNLQNSLSSYFQWQALQKFFRTYGCTLQPDVFRWEVVGNTPTDHSCHFYWIGYKPGGYVELFPKPAGTPLSAAGTIRFGAHNDTDLPPGIVPAPLEGLSSLWTPLQTHMQQQQLHQLSC